jgi:hypothetical protein
MAPGQASWAPSSRQPSGCYENLRWAALYLIWDAKASGFLTARTHAAAAPGLNRVPDEAACHRLNKLSPLFWQDSAIIVEYLNLILPPEGEPYQQWS